MTSPYLHHGEGMNTPPRTANNGAAPSDQSTPSGIKHVPIATWLLALGLAEYESLFSKYNGVEDLLSLSESDIRDLGIRNSAHRARMVSTLVIFKDKITARKMSRGTQRAGVPYTGTPPGSTGLTPPCAANHPDYASVTVPSPSQLTAAKVAQVLLGVANNREHPSMKDLSQFGWYHGNIPRQKAEKLMMHEGEFLVRDSLSQPGDFVLTVFWKGIPLHFVLNKHVSDGPGGQPLIEYQFEDVKFDRPSDLILHYMEQGKTITEMSGAIVSLPVLRTVPLEFYDNKQQDGYSPRGSPWGSPRGSPQSSPRVQRKLGRRTGSQPLLSIDDPDSYLDPPQPISRKTSMPSLQPKLSTPPVNTVNLGMQNSPEHPWYSSLQHVKSSPKTTRKMPIHHRTGSEPVSMPTPSPQPAPRQPDTPTNLTGSDSNLSRNPPPKPSRIPTMRKSIDQRPVIQIRNTDLYDDDGRDYSDYDQIKSWPSSLQQSEPAKSQHQDLLRNSARPSTLTHTYDVPKSQNRNAQFMYDVPKNMGAHISSPLEDSCAVNTPQFTLPDPDPTSKFDLSVYDSELLTPNNKPLEPSAVTTIKSLLLESSPKVIAQHLTSIDLDLLKVTGSHDLGLGVYSGLELLTLPHGSMLRQDSMERYHCLSLFVALTTLMCSMTQDRSQMLHQWIQVAIELRGNLGNLYSFSAVMHGLNSPQIKRLMKTWLTLRQTHTESAFMYEQRLCSLIRSLDNASATLPLQNITIPHIVPLIKLLDRDFSELGSPERHFPDLGSIQAWEEESGAGLDVILAHLDTARVVTQQCGLYKVTAENLMRDFHERRDLADLFRTEMHLKLLWGARGASVGREERHSKFPAILDLLSQRVEPRPSDEKETSV